MTCDSATVLSIKLYLHCTFNTQYKTEQMSTVIELNNLFFHHSLRNPRNAEKSPMSQY